MHSNCVQDRQWDGFDAYLFDIDGTLLHCADAVHYCAFCDVLRRISGRDLTLAGVTAHGNTDVGILRDALALAGVTADAWRPRLPDIRNTMCNFVEEHKSELRVTVLPQVREVLEHLKTRSAVLGIATGNLKEIGKTKLRHAGLLDYFAVGGWSDNYEYRTDVFRGAVEQLRMKVAMGASICVVGDTPSDILAARGNNLPVIAVATGVYSREQLLEHLPDLCLQSFEQLLQASR